MSPNRLRVILVGLVAVAAAISVVGQKTDNLWIGWLSFAVFLCAVGVYFRWRQAVRADVLEREARAEDEARARPDQ